MESNTMQSHQGPKKMIRALVNRLKVSLLMFGSGLGMLAAYVTWKGWFGDGYEEDVWIWVFTLYLFILTFLGMFIGHYTWLYIAHKVFSARELEARAGLEGLAALMALEEEVGSSEGLKKGKDTAIEMIIGRTTGKTDKTAEK